VIISQDTIADVWRNGIAHKGYLSIKLVRPYFERTVFVIPDCWHD